MIMCILQIKDDYMSLVAAACLVVASRQGQGERASQVPTDQQLESVTGLQVSLQHAFSPSCHCHF